MIENDVHIRPLGVGDVKAFRELRLAAMQREPAAFGSSYEEEAACPDEFFAARLHRNHGSVVYGAFKGAELVGMAGMYVLDRRASLHRGTLWGVFVDAGMRAGGVGEMLVRAVIDHAAQTVIILDAKVVSTNDKARRLYRRLGFLPYGTEVKSLRIGGAFYDQELLAIDFSETRPDAAAALRP
ncbi:MAG: GNAT family N-acetyltransferase [Phyllobacterium sp.]